MKNRKNLLGRALSFLPFVFCLFLTLPVNAQSNLEKINQALMMLNNTLSNINNQQNNNTNTNYNSNYNYNSNSNDDYDSSSSNEIATANRQRAYDNMASRAARLYSDLTKIRYSGSARTHAVDLSTYNKLRRDMRKYRTQSLREGITLQKSPYEDMTID